MKNRVKVNTEVYTTRVTATREGKTIVRHKNFFKKLNHIPDSQPKVSVGEEQHIISFPDFPINDKGDEDLQPTPGEGAHVKILTGMLVLVFWV